MTGLAGARVAPPLRAGTLAEIADRISVPEYDRAALVPSVVHISVGSFHRAHQAVYLDELARRGHTGWGLVGVGLRRPELREVLSGQDGLYTVVERGPGAAPPRVVGAITRYLLAPEDRQPVLAALTDPRTRLVTLTITGNGYLLDPMTGEFRGDRGEAAADLAAPHRPRTAIGFLVEALSRRKRLGLRPFTVLSCDNIPDNGAVSRRSITAFAERRDPALARWTAEEGAFPSSMVDRITPRTTSEDRDRIEREIGVRDRWPVITEPFSQWVVEDDFVGPRPPLEEVGVQFVGDVRPYAVIKTRLVNASHAALGYLGILAGHRTVPGAFADTALRRLVMDLTAEEVAPLLPPAPGVDLPSYLHSVYVRMDNPELGDALARLCRNGSTKVPAHLLASIVVARAHRRPHPLLTLAVAAWCRCLRGADDLGQPIALDDPAAGTLRAAARAGGTDARPLLALSSIFGELGTDLGFADELTDALKAIDRLGARGAAAEAVAIRRRCAA